MSIFNGFLAKNHGAVMTTKEPRSACVHPQLIPHWVRVKDMGDEDKADWFTCDNCAEHLSLTEVQGRRIAADWRRHEEFFARSEFGDRGVSGFPDGTREDGLAGANGNGTEPFACPDRTESPSRTTARSN